MKDLKISYEATILHKEKQRVIIFTSRQPVEKSTGSFKIPRYVPVTRLFLAHTHPAIIRVSLIYSKLVIVAGDLLHTLELE